MFGLVADGGCLSRVESVVLRTISTLFPIERYLKILNWIYFFGIVRSECMRVRTKNRVYHTRTTTTRNDIRAKRQDL